MGRGRSHTMVIDRIPVHHLNQHRFVVELEQNTAPSIGLVIPTLNAGARWVETLAAVEYQSIRFKRRLVVDSTSDDATADLARARGFEIKVIPRSEFNHGGTRQLAVEQLTDCDIVVLLTQDAILATTHSISEIVRCFDDQSVAVAYGRQLPHVGATAIEAHARLFNYGTVSLRKDAEAIGQFGTKSFFCSNSFAAYRRAIFLGLGGFRCDLILAEDAEYAARAILAGFANVYCATALVRHSHDYTVTEQLRRYFDLGVFEARAAWLNTRFGSHSAEGVRFVSSEFTYLLKNAAWEIPRAFAQFAAKLAGYRLGTAEGWLPTGIKRKLSMSPRFWK
jgi:rhamnosyltransferase